MLVLAENLILSEADDIPPGTPFIGYHNLVTISNTSADSEDADFPATNLANPLTNIEWRSTSTADQELEFSLNTATEGDYVGIARHNFGTAQISVEVGWYDGVDWVQLVAPQIPPDDAPLMLVFDTQALNFTLVLRLVVGSTAPRAAVVYIGKLLVLERGVDVGTDFPVPSDARKTNSVNGMSEAGDYLGRIVLGQMLQWTATWKHFTPAWYRSYFRPFVRAAQDDTPFFYTWSPDDYPYEVVFAWFADDPIPLTNPATGRVGIDLSCGAIVE